MLPSGIGNQSELREHPPPFGADHATVDDVEMGKRCRRKRTSPKRATMVNFFHVCAGGVAIVGTRRPTARRALFCSMTVRLVIQSLRRSSALPAFRFHGFPKCLSAKSRNCSQSYSVTSWTPCGGDGKTELVSVAVYLTCTDRSSWHRHIPKRLPILLVGGKGVNRHCFVVVIRG